MNCFDDLFALMGGIVEVMKVSEGEAKSSAEQH